MRNMEPGFKVVGSDGKEIGTIANCHRTYCEVNTGILGLGHPVFVPVDAVASVQGESIYLNVPSDRIGEMNWKQPPPGEENTCHPTQVGTFAGTMPASPLPTAPTGQPGAATETPIATNLQTIQKGWPVICAEGKEVGKVTEVLSNALVMSHGWFIFQHKSKVPVDAISRIENHRVYLNVGCSAVKHFPSV